MVVYTVVKGEGIGKKMFVPTINLNPARLPSEFKAGVYACKVFLPDSQKYYKGVLFYGSKASFKQKKKVLEINLFNFAGDLYGAKVEVNVGKFIRAVKKFENLTELKKQIEKDQEEALNQ